MKKEEIITDFKNWLNKINDFYVIKDKQLEDKKNKIKDDLYNYYMEDMLEKRYKIMCNPWMEYIDLGKDDELYDLIYNDRKVNSEMRRGINNFEEYFILKASENLDKVYVDGVYKDPDTFCEEMSDITFDKIKDSDIYSDDFKESYKIVLEGRKIHEELFNRYLEIKNDLER